MLVSELSVAAQDDGFAVSAVTPQIVTADIKIQQAILLRIRG